MAVSSSSSKALVLLLALLALATAAPMAQAATFPFKAASGGMSVTITLKTRQSLLELFGAGGATGLDLTVGPDVTLKAVVPAKVVKAGYAAVVMGTKDDLEANIDGPNVTRLAPAAAGAKKAGQSGQLMTVLKDCQCDTVPFKWRTLRDIVNLMCKNKYGIIRLKRDSSGKEVPDGGFVPFVVNRWVNQFYCAALP